MKKEDIHHMAEKTCKVFTPTETVKFMLDRIGYTDHLYGKKVLENSCGTGQFLEEIVRRYITDAHKNGLSDREIKDGLERDIHGIEREEDVSMACMERLDKVALEFGLSDVKWQLQQRDALAVTYESVYRFVVGNPPYITYYNMRLEDREVMRENYEVCKKGKADYYYAFTEAALKALAPNGRMAYLIPNNFMRNRYSEDLRNYILPYLVELIDFKFHRIFENRQTASAIIICSKKDRKDRFLYVDRENNLSFEILKGGLHGKWMFQVSSEAAEEKKRFGDFFKVSAPIATLLNEAFLIDRFEEADTWIKKDEFQLEKSGLRIAASPKSMQRNEKKYIIFPYYYDEDQRVCRYDEKSFAGRFPQITIYLKQYIDKLLERNADKNSKWFEYGRSQALAHINQEKIMLSTLITGKVKYYRLDKETVPYSGMYIVPKENYTLDQAEQILNSSEFYEYVASVGINASGKTYRISPRDVEDYRFVEKW